MQRREQFEPLAVLGPRDQRHFAAAQAVIGQRDRPGRGLRGELETVDPRAQFSRQRQRTRCRDVVLFERKCEVRQKRRVARGIAALGQDLDLARAAWAQAMRGQLDRAIGEDGGLQCEKRCRAFEHGDAAALFQRLEQRRTAVAGEPVGEPVGLEGAVGQGGEGRLGACGIRRPGGGDHAGDPVLNGARRLEDGRFGAGQHERGDGAVVAARLRHDAIEHLRLGAPVGCRGPAAIHHDEKGRIAAGCAVVLGIEDRARQPQDDRGHRQHPQEQKPPGRAVADLFVILEAEQKHDPGKEPPHRRRRHRAQDQPEDRQGQQAQQKPGRREADGPEQRHPWLPSSARQIHRSADCGESDVWWHS